MKLKSRAPVAFILMPFAVACVVIYHAHGAQSTAPTVDYASLPAGTYQESNLQYGNEYCSETSLGQFYYFVGASSKPTDAIGLIQRSSDGSIRVPTLDESAWGDAVDGVQIGLVADRTSAKPHEPIWAQLTIKNDNKSSFEIRYGCGRNMVLAMPQVRNAGGARVKENFTIGQNVCAGTWGYGVLGKTTATYFFNLADLYDVNNPGRYTAKFAIDKVYGIGYDIHDKPNSAARGRSISSNAISFTVL